MYSTTRHELGPCLHTKYIIPHSLSVVNPNLMTFGLCVFKVTLFMIVFNVKKCNTCQIEKSILKFNHARDGKFQVTSECKDCRIKYQRKHRQKQRDKINKDKLSSIGTATKICTTCQQEFPANDQYFRKSSSGKYGLDAKCRVCLRQKYLETRDDRLKKAREYYPKNKERIKQRTKQWRLNNKDKRAANAKKYRQKHKSQLAKCAKDRRNNDIEYRLVGNLRCRIRHSLKGCKKDQTTMKLVGCTTTELREHLESQFVDGMTWDNYGEWHIDHIKPCAAFDLSDPAQQKECFHYTNLQPLWAIDNYRKSDKYQ